ncbi:MAG: Hsp70 family protein [Desulfobacterales bacterium]
MTTDIADHRFIIGIDLGTTNCAVSYVDLQAKGSTTKRIRIFKIPQMTGSGEVNRLPVLPSFLYIPGEFDISREAIVELWEGAESNFAGAFARDHGAQVPARLVSSAKSWLCHANVDRQARILPWGADKEVPKVSPVMATAAYLKHIRMAWNDLWGPDDSLLLENQLIIATVPASFDEVARELTLEAAKLGGLNNVILLEEPLAAFYSWLMRHEKDWQDFVQTGELILVCDVGGGTTDFTLIVLKEAEGSPRFERIAVGDHLILGGDNIDLALARRVETGLTGPRRSMSTNRWKALCHQCRQAKETILGGSAETFKVTLMGEGSRLIAGTLSAELGQDEVIDTILEGFFPLVAAETVPNTAGRKGITEFGLPYEQEPAITRHLGRFLEQHRDDIFQTLQRQSSAPDLILYNGGSLRPAKIQQRIRAALRHWYRETDSERPRVLENPDPDLAVALGAAYYGLVKVGEGVRVGSGSPRGYYLGIARSETVEQDAPDMEAICVVERGLEEGSTIGLKDNAFEVLTNQPVSFDLYSSSYRSGDRHGDVIRVDDSFAVLPPLQTMIQYGKKGHRKTIPVKIEAEYTELGTLALWCRSRISDHRWKLQFQLRDTPVPEVVADAQILEASVTEDVLSYVRDVLSGNDKQQAEKLVKGIGGIVDLPRSEWPLGFIRTLTDELLALLQIRKKGPIFESSWMNLLGFCLRPGIGEGFDPQRMRQLWRLYQSGAASARHQRVRLEWWIMWRRVAAGLTPGQQRQFFQDVSVFLLGKKGEIKKITPQEHLEVWMAVANMEKLYYKEKIELGRKLLAVTSAKKLKAQHLWALSRLGSRELLYGPADRVIPPAEVADWIDQLIGYSWSNPNTVGRTVSQLARKTGDRSRDLDDKIQAAVLDWMAQNDMPEDRQRRVREIVPLAYQDRDAMFGESLPQGIILRG